MHDRIAELRGLRAEHARYAQYDRSERAEQVGVELDRVREELAAEAGGLEERAAQQAADGQDVTSAQSAVAAREIRALLDEDAPAPAARAKPAGTGGKRNTAAAKAPEQV